LSITSKKDACTSLQFMMNCLLLISILFIQDVCPSSAATIVVTKASDELTFIWIEGEIDYRDDVEFRLKSFDTKKAVVALSSPGGNLDAGLSIGKQIRENGYSTLVGSKLCASACALAWLGGVRRYMTPEASIGFHAAYTKEGTYVRESGMANALVGSYLSKLGLSDEAILYITSAPPEYLNWLGVDDARRLGIDALVLDKGKVTSVMPSEIDPSPTAKRAAISFYKRMNQSGMFGVRESVEKCYQRVLVKKDKQTLEYCVILDWCALNLDKSFADIMKGPRIEFFSEASATERFIAASKKVNWQGGNPVVFFRTMTALAAKLVSDKAIYEAAK
jgi:hypothetical protein